MRKATDIERILCDVKDLAHSVSKGDETIINAYLDEDDDLIIITHNISGTSIYPVGFKLNDHDELIKKAWELYLGPEKEDIADYTRYDALFDVTKDIDIPDEEFQEMMDEMECF